MTDPTDKQTPSYEEIATKAYQIYVTRTEAGTPGDELSDWFQAEQELNSNPQP